MHSTAAERPEFTPPDEKGGWRALALALLVHLLLIAALTWGVHWKRSEDMPAFEAELWSSTVQQAAPQAVEPPAPEEAPAPAPETRTATTAPAVLLPSPVPAPVKAPEARMAPPLPDADIALENEKKRQQAQKLKEQQQAELQAREEKERQQKKEKERQELAERQAKAEKEAEKKQQAQVQEKQKLAAEKQKLAEAEKQKAATAATNAAAADKAAAAAEKKKQAAAAEKQHQEAVRRIMGMAGAAGSPDATGTSAKASGPSAGYAGKVKARVLPNVVFTEDIDGNPTAEVEVRTTADGTILSQRLVKSSGNKAWDEAVIKAIIRTGAMPRDTDGRVPTPMIIEFRPN